MSAVYSTPRSFPNRLPTPKATSFRGAGSVWLAAITAFRVFGDLAGIQEHQENLKNSVPYYDAPSTRFSVAHTLLCVVDLTDAAIQTAVRCKAWISWIPSWLSSLMLPVGAALLGLTISLDMNDMNNSATFYREINEAFPKDKPDALPTEFAQFLTRTLHCTDAEKDNLKNEIQKKEGTTLPDSDLKVAMIHRKFASLVRNTSGTVASQFTMLDKERVQTKSLDQTRVTTVLENVRQLHVRKTALKVISIAASILMIVATACLLWHSAALGAALFNLVLVIRLASAVYKSVGLEAGLMLEPLENVNYSTT